ncbi:uncharacterized protein UTRI_06203_B [Ustilago trichophora]|uniref:Effector family protein Eff1 n=1 Tax=Ustilago trichophora TaxID=86804 RepID=A0A5C3EI50_9BASI|nr:uncharacterized protein UTRI_06203_B [Ustilago trichophora]
MLCHFFFFAFTLARLVAGHENLPVLPAILNPNVREPVPPHNVPQLVVHFNHGIREAHEPATYNDRAANLAREATIQIEDSNMLPRGHLYPTYAYQPSQQGAIEEYLRRPGSQIHLLFRRGPIGQGWTLFGSPVYMHSPLLHNRAPNLVLLKVFDNGEVEPIGYTGAEGVRMSGGRRNFWESLVRFPSDLTWELLSSSSDTPLRFRPL